ncbi:melanoma-associated antigen B4-like [Ctenodactylus gundi]
MPRGQKSKLLSRLKRQQARRETQRLKDAEATAEGESDSSSKSPTAGRGTSPSSPQNSPSSACPEAGASGTSSDVSAQSPVGAAQEKRSSIVQAATFIQSSHRDLVIRKMMKLVQFLLDKFETEESVTQAEMLKVVNKRYKEHFPEILRQTSECIDLMLALELKEVPPGSQSYVLVSKLGPSSLASLSGIRGLPKKGLLMTLLGVIFTRGNRATEEEIWEFLNGLGIYAGNRHTMYGEPYRLITQEFVREKYLEYHQVPGTDPPRYVFQWGCRAKEEISKMQVLEMVAKINDTIPSSFADLYDEARRDERERAARRLMGNVDNAARARAHPKADSHSSSHN